MAVEQIDSNEEKSRRSYADRRHSIYRDGGREYLIEALKAEFEVKSVTEFRLCPLNFLKKIVQKKSQIFKTPPIRTPNTDKQTDQDLIDFYTSELAFDVQMKKANEYYNLHSNTALYVFPKRDFLDFRVVPPHLYSIVPNPLDRTEVEVWIFNNFAQKHESIAQTDLPAATGMEGFQRDQRGVGKVIATDQIDTDETERFIIWSDFTHATITKKGKILALDPTKGDEQFMNPIGRAPIHHLQRDTDNEAWAQQGEDAADISILLQRMWTDLCSTIKMQGYGQLVISSEEPPKNMVIGLNKVLWARRTEGREPPTFEYISADSRISEIKETLRDLLFLLLTTNDINPSAVGKPDGGASFNSGIQALLEMSDALDAMKADQPAHRDAEKEVWDIVKRWHNWMFDVGIIREDAKKLGKFSEDFEVQVIFAELKPIETERDRLDLIEQSQRLNLITRKDALKKLHPEKKDEEIDLKIEELDEEKQALIQQFGLPPPKSPIGEPDGEES